MFVYIHTYIKNMHTCNIATCVLIHYERLDTKGQVAQLNKIIKSAKSGTSRGSVVKKIKSWASSAHKTAQKYGLYTKGLQAARLGYNAWQAKKGNTARIGYTPTRSIQYVD